MKIKGIDRTANIAWSPPTQFPIYLAAGTADQPLLSTAAALEIYELNLADPGHDMVLKSSAQTEHRFHKLKWGTHGQSSGTIVGGCDGGVIEIYNTAKCLNGEKGLVSEHSKHKGPVKALDFNSFQSNLLASGASESEIYIWDLNNPSTPMTPGSKSQPLEDITSVAWNKQVQHILASSFPSKCVVWDLRKNDPIIKLSDNTVRIRWSVVAWNPDIATQLCLGSEADQSPVVQLWDLRFATSPLKILENHRQGVLSISWCQQDTDMLLSCGRDNKIYCWNPNSSLPGAEVNCEITSSDQWNFDIAWCPKNPALFACSSFDGHVSIYSLVGGPQQVQTSNKIADSFPGMELYTQAPVPQSHSVPVELKRAPKWMKRPVRASFGFGGKLVTIENVAPTNNETPATRRVYISQVVTEPELVSRSVNLESTLQNGQFIEFCQSKIMNSTDSKEKNLWQFLSANFDPSPRLQFLNLLGFHGDEINSKLASVIGKSSNLNDEVRQINDRMATLGRSTESDSELEGYDDLSNNGIAPLSGEGAGLGNCSDFELPASNVAKDFKISAGDDPEGLICQALLLGNTEAAVELCLQSNRMADAIILAMTGGSELLAKAQFKYFQKSNGYLSSLISAVVTEDWSQVIRNCDIDSWREALAAAISHTNDQTLPILCEILGERLENEKNGALAQNAQLCYICAGNLGKLVSSWLKPEGGMSPEKMQDLVELVMILKKSLELQGLQVDVSSRLADLLTKYAAVLASQGNLEAAISYLGDSNDPQIAELRERLSYSVGRARLPTAQNQPKQRGSLNQGTTMQPGFYKPPKKQEDLNQSLQQANFNLHPMRSNPTPTHNYPALPIAPAAPLPMAPTVPPPLPGTYPCPSPGPGSGVSLRSKHVLDPSVQSSATRSLSTPQFYPQNQFQSTPYPPAPQPVQPHNFNLNPTGYPPEVFNPSANSVLTPQPSLPKPPPPSAQAPGWNDPPVVDTSRNMLHYPDYYHHQPKQEFVQQTPITHPLMSGTVPDPALNGQAGDYFHNAPPQQQQQQQQYPYQTYPVQQQFSQQYQNQNYPKQEPVMPAKQVREEPVKKAIPEEHVILRTVFDELRNKCLAVANNPQSKKKLDDVSKKLEALYDNLRDGRLSSNTLQGLHLMAQHIQSGNYTNGLMLHTQLVSGPDFSQIASFMPGLKVLLKSALQSEVYL
ncbi:UNVERIFIED_CONTAM: hypothetical protein PYX00_003452 [Menopon gallinae]|uniref:Protein transport protein Sec31A n=1 Tax=Menopon gallinae TaxID=328185 RepID=A0AAW2I0H1_9NEOP